jgi:hypothetical protein
MELQETPDMLGFPVLPGVEVLQVFPVILVVLVILAALDPG